MKLTPDELWRESVKMLSQIHEIDMIECGCGEMFLRNRTDITPTEARKRYAKWARETAAGESSKPLSAEACWILGQKEESEERIPKMPDDVCTLLCVPIGSRFGDLFNAV